MKNNFVIFLISILFLCITDKKLRSEDIISLIGEWKGVNKSYSTEKGYRTWKKKITIFEQNERIFKGNSSTPASRAARARSTRSPGSVRRSKRTSPPFL